MEAAIDLGPTAGAVLLGLAFACVAFGMTNIQSVDYYRNYPNDWWLFRISVAILWILDAAHVALTVHVAYYYLVDNFGNYFALNTIAWSFKVQVVINIVIIIIVQTLYAARFWRLGPNNRVLPSIISFVVIGGYIIGIWECVVIFPLHSFAELNSVYNTTIATFSVATFIDIAIVVGTVYYLQGHRSKAHFAETSSKLTALIVYVIASGALTSACSIATLVTYAVMPTNLIFMGIEFLLTKLYINSFLAMLNARKRIRGKHDSSAIALSIRSGTASSNAPPYPRSPLDKDKDKDKFNEA